MTKPAVSLRYRKSGGARQFLICHPTLEAATPINTAGRPLRRCLPHAQPQDHYTWITTPSHAHVSRHAANLRLWFCKSTNYPTVQNMREFPALVSDCLCMPNHHISLDYTVLPSENCHHYHVLHTCLQCGVMCLWCPGFKQIGPRGIIVSVRHKA